MTWWRSLRHQWLYLNHVDSIATERRPIAFYVRQHNTVMPHSAFMGQTPDEMYFGRGDDVVDDLADRRKEARRDRVEVNRRKRCRSCPHGALDAYRESAA